MTQVGSIGLRTPAAWWDLDLDPATRATSMDRLLAERAPGREGAVRPTLEAATDDAVAHGAVFASIFADTFDGKAVSASLVVSVVDAEAGDEADFDPDGLRLAIAQGLTAEFRADGAAAEVRTIEAGPAARVRSRVPLAGGPEVGTVQYFVPFPRADRLAVLTFSTPNVGLADAFAEVFDAIASTLQWPN
jgi:hypothetical protein